MVIDMNLLKLTTLAQVREFLQGTQTLELVPRQGPLARYAHVARTLDRLGYAQLGRKDRSLVLRYLERTSGYASAQVTRLVARVLAGEALTQRYVAPKHAWAQRFTPEDIPLRQNSCRPNRSKNLGAAMKDANGTIRTDIQRQSGSATATARERHSGSGSPGSRHWSGNTAALA